MDKLFDSFKSLWTKTSECVIDNHIFRLHYRFSVIVLAAFSFMNSATVFLGDPIDCISKDDIPHALLNTWCWIHTTFSLDNAWYKKVGVEVPYPGVDKYTPGSADKRIYHSYYQWVCFVLFFQAIAFYIPHYIWKAFEGGRTKTLTLGLNSPIMSDQEKEKNRGIIITYLFKRRGRHNYNFLAYCVTELLNFFNVLLQMYVMDRFLSNQFWTYGWKVLQFTEWDWSVRYDPMIKVFPRLTKCTFHRFGSSGDVQSHDAMCILPINILNEKIYVFLWFWFYFLAIASFLTLLYRLLTVFNLKVRILAFKTRCAVIDPEAVEGVARRLRVGDWFLLDLLSKNIDPLNFRDLINDYYHELNDGRKVSASDDL